MADLNNPTFSFDFICREEIVKEIDKLCNKKASQSTDIPIKIIKENKYVTASFLHRNFNKSLSCSIFLTAMKYVDVKPIHKKDDKTDK